MFAEKLFQIFKFPLNSYALSILCAKLSPVAAESFAIDLLKIFKSSEDEVIGVILERALSNTCEHLLPVSALCIAIELLKTLAFLKNIYSMPTVWKALLVTSKRFPSDLSVTLVGNFLKAFKFSENKNIEGNLGEAFKYAVEKLTLDCAKEDTYFPSYKNTEEGITFWINNTDISVSLLLLAYTNISFNIIIEDLLVLSTTKMDYAVSLIFGLVEKTQAILQIEKTEEGRFKLIVLLSGEKFCYTRHVTLTLLTNLVKQQLNHPDYFNLSDIVKQFPMPLGSQEELFSIFICLKIQKWVKNADKFYRDGNLQHCVSLYEKAAIYNEQEAEKILATTFYLGFPNMACSYWQLEYIEKAEILFQKSMAQKSTSSILVEYAFFLLEATVYLPAPRAEEALLLLREVLNAPPDDSGLSYSLLEYKTFEQTLLGDELLHYEKFSIHPYTFAGWLLYQYFKQDEQITLNERLAWITVLATRLFNEAPQHEIEWVLCGYLLADIGCIKAAKICFSFVENPSEQASALQVSLELSDSLIQQSKEIQLLVASACEGKLEGVQFCCGILGVDSNFIADNSDNQCAALYWACIKKHIPIIRYLLNQGARFDIPDAMGQFAWEYVMDVPVIIQVFQENFFKKYKLDQQSLYQQKDAVGKVLRIAAGEARLSDVRFCIEVLRIDVNEADKNPQSQKTSLHWAVMKGHIDIVQYLVSKRAQVDLIDAKGKTALNYAQEFEDNTKKEILLTVLGQPPHVSAIFTI